MIFATLCSRLFWFLTELTSSTKRIKTLVHPLYKFTEGYNPFTKSFKSTKFLRSPCNHAKMCDIFASIESTTAQACSIYNLISAYDHHESVSRLSTSLSELNTLLNALTSTVSNIPPFALGENSLVWVYSVAASQSSRPEHCVFFTSQLAELLRRVGHQDISGYLYIFLESDLYTTLTPYSPVSPTREVKLFPFL
jgi:hypothetical protein